MELTRQEGVFSEYTTTASAHARMLTAWRGNKVQAVNLWLGNGDKQLGVPSENGGWAKYRGVATAKFQFLVSGVGQGRDESA